MGINLIDFQIDPHEDYVDLSHSYFEVEWRLKKSNAANMVVAKTCFWSTT